ncbi:DUF1460 domain-containing protein [Patescibacteria group bacterium]|nr:DUF1460 domain-containing protein [Patescibacteria group bacterium]
MKKSLLIITIISFVIVSAIIVLYQPEQIEKRGKVPEEITQEETRQEEKKNYEESNWQWVNNQKRLYQLSPPEINLILKELQKQFPNKDERLKALAILRLGTPYQLGCLGEESGKDKDPIFRLDVTDCTVFILTNAALLHAQDLEGAKEMMKFLNYRPDKEITFENRLHFTTDRNMASPYFEDITEQIAGSSRVKEKRVVLNKVKANGKRLIDINWEKEVIIKHIPNKYITRELLSSLPKTISVAFIKEGDENIGLDVRHEGFLFDNQSLFHATSAQGGVMAVDFFEYYFGENGKEPRFDSIILFEIK